MGGGVAMRGGGSRAWGDDMAHEDLSGYCKFNAPVITLHPNCFSAASCYRRAVSKTGFGALACKEDHYGPKKR